MEAKSNYEVGYKKPPQNRQFGQPGGNMPRKGLWDITSSPRYKLEQMMKMSSEELRKVATDGMAPLFERKIAECLKSGDWKTIESMINQVYGKPKESMDVTSAGQAIQGVTVKLVGAAKK